MVSLTNEILSGIEGRAGLETISRRMYELNNPIIIRESSGLNLERRVSRSGWANLRRFAGYTLLSLSTLIGSATAGVGLGLTKPWNAYASASQQEQAQEIIFSNPRPSLDDVVSAGTKSLTIFVDTNVNADLRWEHASPDTPYEEMRFPFTNTGGTRHSTEIPGLADGNKYYIFIKGRNKETGIESLEYTLRFGVSTDKIPVEFNVPVVGIFSRAGAGSGGLFLEELNNRQIPMVNSRIMIRKGDGVVPGVYKALLKSDIGEDRYFFLNVTPTEVYVDLGGGRKGAIDVIEKDPRVGIEDWREFANYALDRYFGKRVSNRILAPLKIGLLDEWIYSVDGRNQNLIREERATMNPVSRANLYNVLRNYNRKNESAFWTMGLYPEGDLLNRYFFVQSMGHGIPENRYAEGWLIIYASDHPCGTLCQADSAGQPGGGRIIKWANIEFNAAVRVHELGWSKDIKESWGFPEVTDAPHESDLQTEKMRKYVLVLFSRPPWLEVPDSAVSLPIFGISQREFGTLDFFSQFYRR